MNKPNAPFARMPFYPRDFRSSTLGWPLVARGAYHELLGAQWDHGGSGSAGTLPDDPEALRAIAGATPAEWSIAWRYLEPKFPRVDGGRRNPRLEIHRQQAVAEFHWRQRGAQITNAKRWGNGRSAISERSVSESLSDRTAGRS